MDLLYNEVIDFLDDTTWLPNTFKLASYISLMSFISRRAFHISYSLADYYPNTFVLLIGESGTGKGIALERFLKRIIYAIDNEVILPEFTTPEKLLHLLSNNSIRHWINDEISSLITQKKYMSDIVDILNYVYNSDREQIQISRMNKKSSFTIHNPTLSIAFGTQPNTLNKIMKYSNITSGFIPRFLVFYGKKQDIKDVKREGLRDIVMRVGKMYELSSAIIHPIMVTHNKEFSTWLHNLINKIKKNMDEDTMLYYARINDHIYKIALLFTVDAVLSNIENCHIDNVNIEYNKDIHVPTVYTVSTVTTVTLHEYINIGWNCHMDEFQRDMLGQCDSSQFSQSTIDKIDVTVEDENHQTVSLNIHTALVRSLTEYVLQDYIASIDELLENQPTYDQTILNRHVRAIKRVIEKMNIKENEDGELIVNRREVVRYLHTTVIKLRPYERTLKELGVIKEIRYEGKKWIWIIDKEELERYGGMI